MFRDLFPSALVLLMVLSSGVTSYAQDGTDLLKPRVMENKEDDQSLIGKASYSMGQSMYKSLAKTGQDIDTQQLQKGSQARLDGKKLESYIAGYQSVLQAQAAGGFDAEQFAEGVAAAQGDQDMKSMIAGYQIMGNFEKQGLILDLPSMVEGLEAAKAGKSKLSEEEEKAVQQAYTRLMQKKRVEMMKMKGGENAEKGQEFMAKAKAENADYKALPNGVQYLVMEEGAGPSPAKADRVRVNYHGTFIDGEVFDTTRRAGRGPAVFPVDRVVPGFSASLQAMKVGDKWKVIIPGDLAYGPAGSPPKIGPNQTLIFEIELLEILPN